MKKESNSQLALNAMHRASKKAVEKAANLDLSIPVWKVNLSVNLHQTKISAGICSALLVGTCISNILLQNWQKGNHQRIKVGYRYTHMN